MVKRLLTDWLTAHIEYTDNSESPVSYHTWAGISCIASSLEKKVHMKMGLTTLYPNLYVILIGPTGGRKAEPISLTNRRLRAINVTTAEEDITAEALIKEIKNAEYLYEDQSTGNRKMQSSVAICAEELAVFLGEKNTRLQAYLTRWFDGPDQWGRKTKGAGSEDILGININLLASSAPSWLPYILSKEAVGGGFTGRCIFVVEQGKRKTVVDPDASPPDLKLGNDLLHDLEIIRTLNGQYTFSKEAKYAYETWYRNSDNQSRTRDSIFGEPNLEGYVSRRQTHLRKVAMCISASYKDDLVVSLEDFQRAQLLLEATEVNMPKAFSTLGKADYAEGIDRVLGALRNKRNTLHSELMTLFYRDIDDQEMTRILKVLEQMKVIKVVLPSKGKDLIYSYQGES